MANCRPISLLTVFPKYSRKLRTTPEYKQHTDHRRDGFMEGITTENSAFRLTNCLLKSINKNNAYGRKFLRLGKGFDYVNHEILLVHLQFYGIRHVVEDCFGGSVI
jgi:hypothetical protein